MCNFYALWEKRALETLLLYLGTLSNQYIDAFSFMALHWMGYSS